MCAVVVFCVSLVTDATTSELCVDVYKENFAIGPDLLPFSYDISEGKTATGFICEWFKFAGDFEKTYQRYLNSALKDVPDWQTCRQIVRKMREDPTIKASRKGEICPPEAIPNAFKMKTDTKLCWPLYLPYGIPSFEHNSHKEGLGLGLLDVCFCADGSTMSVDSHQCIPITTTTTTTTPTTTTATTIVTTTTTPTTATVTTTGKTHDCVVEKHFNDHGYCIPGSIGDVHHGMSVAGCNQLCREENSQDIRRSRKEKLCLYFVYWQGLGSCLLKSKECKKIQNSDGQAQVYRLSECGESNTAAITTTAIATAAAVTATTVPGTVVTPQRKCKIFLLVRHRSHI